MQTPRCCSSLRLVLSVGRNDPRRKMCQTTSFNLFFGNFLTQFVLVTGKATHWFQASWFQSIRDLLLAISGSRVGSDLKENKSSHKKFLSRELLELTLQDPRPPGSAAIFANEYNFIHSADLWALILDRDPIRSH